MTIKSRRNVYYDLDKSPFKAWFGKMEFTFSSEFNLNRFQDQITEHINKRVKQYESVLKVSVGFSFHYVAVLDLYKRIEKRGSNVKYKGVDLSCNLILESEIKTLKNSQNLTDPRKENKTD